MKKRIKLKTSFGFDAAHRLVGYPGKCQNIHGHIWRVELWIEGASDMLDSNGILWDFSNVKLLKELFDHKTILKECEENIQIINILRAVNNLDEENDNVYLMDENPTAENLCFEIIEHLTTSNPNLKYKVRVWESSKSSCEVESDSK